MKKSLIAAFLLAVLWVGLWIGVSQAGLQVPLTRSMQVDTFASLEPNSFGGIPRNGLLVEFSMDSIDGSTLIDTSGSGNHGTITGATTTTGRVGNALNFDGNDFVAVPTGTIVSGASPRTISFWMYVASWSQDRTAYFSGDQTTGEAFSFSTNTATTVNFYSWGGGSYDDEVSFSYVGSWVHVLLIYTGTHKVMYLNNVEKVNDAVVLDTGTTTHNIGKIVSTAFFVGKIDQFRIYNRVLSASERTILYNGGQGI